MIQTIIKVGVAAMILFLGGCGTMANRMAPELLTSLSPTEGRVVLSGGAAGRCISFSTFLTTSPYGSEYTRDQVALFPIDAYLVDSDFTDQFGVLSVKSLPPGRYQIAPWLANGAFTPLRVPRYVFDVRAGETVYIGSFQMWRSCSTSTEGEFVDYSERDLAMLRERNPLFENEPITTRIAVPDGLAYGKPLQ